MTLVFTPLMMLICITRRGKRNILRLGTWDPSISSSNKIKV